MSRKRAGAVGSDWREWPPEEVIAGILSGKIPAPSWWRKALSPKGSSVLQEWYRSGRWVPGPYHERADDKIIGWKAIAAALCMDERNLRRAYQSDPLIHRIISKTGGRYWTTVWELASFFSEIMNRKENWPHRAERAERQERGKRKQFAKRRDQGRSRRS